MQKIIKEIKERFERFDGLDLAFVSLLGGILIMVIVYMGAGWVQKEEEVEESFFEIGAYEIVEDNSVETILKKQVGDDIYILSLDRFHGDLYHTEYDGKGVPKTIQLIKGDENE